MTAMAQLIVDLCQGLGLDRIDPVGNDTLAAWSAQIVAARHPELLRSLVLTNCDTEGNFPPQAFMPVIEAAVRGEIAPLLTVAAANPAAARMSPLATGYEHPDKVPDEVCANTSRRSARPSSGPGSSSGRYRPGPRRARGGGPAVPPLGR